MKLSYKIFILTFILIIFVISIIFYFIVITQRKDISLEIYRSSISFSETVKKDIYNNFIRFYESGILKFKGLTNDIKEINTNIKNIQIYNYNGYLLYDLLADKEESNVYKKYKENPQKTNDHYLLEAIKSVETMIYITNNDKKNIIPKHKISDSIIINNNIKYIITPILDENNRHEYSIVYEITYENLEKKFKEMLINIISIFIAFVVLSLILSIILSKSLTKNLNQVTLQISNIAKEGNFNKKIEVKSSDEVSILAKTFNEMAQKIEESQKKEIENQKLQKEAEIVQDIQNSILPNPIPKIPNLEITTYYKPASKAGGDMYDIINVDNNYFLYIADVSGHGSGPSILAAIINNLFYSYAKLNISLTNIVLYLHNIILNKLKLKNKLYLTAFFTKWNSDEKKLRYISSGHIPMLIYKYTNKEIIEIEKGGFPIGMISFTEKKIQENIQKNPKFLYENEIKLDENDIVILYTDGVIEAKNANNEDYGLDNLKNLIKKYCENKENININNLLEEILIDIKKHTKDYEQKDDITFVIMKVF